MNGYVAFVKKEIKENMRTYRMFVLLVVFLLFGFMSPILAKLTPELLRTFMPKGVNITLPTPTAMDSWMQFYKNVNQMGLIVLVIVFGGVISNEISKGTLINMLTKGLPRFAVILAKFTASTLIWSVSYWLCAAVSWFYTYYLWRNQHVNNLPMSLTGVWLFGVFLIASVILGGVLFKGQFGSLLFTFGLVALMMVSSIIGSIQRFVPLMLVSKNTGLHLGVVTTGDFMTAMLVTIAMASLFIVISVSVFNKRQI